MTKFRLRTTLSCCLSIIRKLASRLIYLFLIRNKIKYFKFEGGLGSQLLTAMDIEMLQVYDKRSQIRINFDYFQDPKTSRNSEGLSFWKWELDRYGATQADFKAKFATYSEKFLQPKPQRYLFLNCKECRNYLRLNADRLFPIDRESLRRNILDIGATHQFSVIHIRRGDYVRIGAHQTALEDYLDVVSLFEPLIVGTLIVTSDSEVPSTFVDALSSIVGKNVSVCVISNLRAIEIHDLMRSAEVLIASNSTFSISAGMLAREGAKVLIPVNYFGSKEGFSRENPFLCTGKFFVLS